MEIPSTGNIKDISLVKILVQLNRSRKTGTLTISSSSASKNIYLKMGDVIFASSTYEDDRLGEMLIKAGKITVEQYDKSVAVLKATGKRQGAILVELGYLTPKQIFLGLKYQVNEIIQSMFLLEDARYDFKENDLPTQEVIALKMSMGNLIYAGINRITHWTRIRNEMPDTDSVLKISEDPLSLFQDIELSSQDKKMISLIDGKKTIKEIIDSAWTSSFEALKILYVLWSIGIIEESAKGETLKSEEDALLDIFKPFSDEQEPVSPAEIDSLFAKLGTLSLSELLEVDWKADTEAIRKSYYRLAKEYHPDRHFASGDPATKMKLTAIIEALSKAYQILRDNNLRSEYYRALVAPKKAAKAEVRGAPEDLFKRGTAELKNRNFPAAVGHLETATSLKPDSAQYLNYLSLAYSKIPGRMKDAEDALQRAIKIEPFNPDLHANLGLLYFKSGFVKKAQSSLQKALKIDPKHEKAQKGLRHTTI
jgi:tetratricopeptide (TPR) repeat protein